MSSASGIRPQNELEQILALPESCFMRAAFNKVAANRAMDVADALSRVKGATVKFILKNRGLIPCAEWVDPKTIHEMQEMASRILAKRAQNTLAFFDHVKQDAGEDVRKKVDSLPTHREKAQVIHAWAETTLPTLSANPGSSPLQFSPLARFLGLACETNAIGVAQIIIDSAHFRRITNFNLDLLVAPLVLSGNLTAAKLFINSSRFNEVGVGTLGMMLTLATKENDPIVEKLLRDGNFFVSPGPPLLEIERALKIAKEQNSRFLRPIQALCDKARLVE